MDTEKLELGNFHPVLRSCFRVLTKPLLARPAPSIRSRTVRFGAPEKTHLLATVDGAAHVDTCDGEVLGAVFSTGDLLKVHEGRRTNSQARLLAMHFIQTF